MGTSHAGQGARQAGAEAALRGPIARRGSGKGDSGEADEGPAYFGTLFESLVVRDLRIHAQAVEATVFHYRDNADLEVDAVVDRDDGCWAAFEVTLGQHEVEKAAATLLRFASKIDTTRTGKPGMLAVITGMGYGYQRPDGVAVIPVGALAP